MLARRVGAEERSRLLVVTDEKTGALLLEQRRLVALLVEDDEPLREFLAETLGDCGVEAIECESAEAALATALTRSRDLVMIISDVRLSGQMDGIDFASEARLRWPSLPFILISGAWHERLKNVPIGVRFFAKPLDLEQLERATLDAVAAARRRSHFAR